MATQATPGGETAQGTLASVVHAASARLRSLCGTPATTLPTLQIRGRRNVAARQSTRAAAHCHSHGSIRGARVHPACNDDKPLPLTSHHGGPFSCSNISAPTKRDCRVGGSGLPAWDSKSSTSSMKDTWRCPNGRLSSGCSRQMSALKATAAWLAENLLPISSPWAGPQSVEGRWDVPQGAEVAAGTRGSSPAAPSACLLGIGNLLPPPSPFVPVAQPGTYQAAGQTAPADYCLLLPIAALPRPAHRAVGAPYQSSPGPRVECRFSSLQRFLCVCMQSCLCDFILTTGRLGTHHGHFCGEPP